MLELFDHCCERQKVECQCLSSLITSLRQIWSKFLTEIPDQSFEMKYRLKNIFELFDHLAESELAKSTYFELADHNIETEKGKTQAWSFWSLLWNRANQKYSLTSLITSLRQSKKKNQPWTPWSLICDRVRLG